MLRLPEFDLREPETVDEVAALLAEHPGEAMLIAGGTDLLPNMKHGLFEPKVLVSLARVEALRGVRETADGLSIGAMTTLAEVAADERIPPALAQATGLIAGPQLRTMGTLGGNVMLDTRCQWYNQTHFWRQALGFCLKKDGTLCHVVEGGGKCVAAASNDSAPALMTLGATVCFVGPDGPREVAIADLYLTDGIWNKAATPDELLVEVRVPAVPAGHRGAYGKLRDRGSIDFPLFGCAARLDLDEAGAVAAADLCAVALVARPSRVKRVDEALVGTTPGTPAFDEAVEAAADLAYRQCRPMDNVPGDAAYRREMVPVYVRRTLHAAAAGEGPVHHV
jgi:4-hydroxybenzoyl-CoA reductase subunit beta